MARATGFHRKCLLAQVHKHECHALADLGSVKFRIKKEPPPNFEAIKKVFPFAARPGVLFTHGDTIYNPSGFDITPSLVAHECTHMLQQEKIGVEHWWEFYLKDKQFRFGQELDAYRLEFRDFSCNHNRAMRKQYLRSCAERLSGPLYGRMLRRKHAQELIELPTDAEMALYHARLREKFDGRIAA